MNASVRMWPLAAVVGIAVQALPAQCTLSWQQYALGGTALVNVGREWDPDGAGPQNPRYVFAGGFTGTPGGSTQSIAAVDVATNSWFSFGGGLTYEVDAVAPVDGGVLYAGGGLLALPPFFPGFGSVDRWDGSSWTNIGGGNNYVWDLLVLPNGDLVAGGSFTMINGMPANHVARWDGSSWHAMGAGIDDRVMQFALSPAGELYACGWFTSAGGVASNGGIVRWDGSNWQNLPSAGSVVPAFLTSFAFRPGGEIVATGVFFDPLTSTQYTVAEWDGAGWHNLGSGPDGATVSVAVLPNQAVVVSGFFQNAGGQPANNVARWNGSVWSGLGSSPGMGSPQQVITVNVLQNGVLMAGGAFGTTPGTNYDRSLASLSTSCPATVSSIGTGCTAGAGTLALSATSLPWIGGTFRSETTGMAVGSIGVTIWGANQLALPLASVLPFAGPGCTLLASPDLLEVSIVTTPVFEAVLQMPFSQALVGLDLQHQTASLDLGPTGFTGAATSNGLSLQFGAL